MSKNTANRALLAERLAAVLSVLPSAGHLRIDALNDFTLPANWGFRGRVNDNYHLAYVRSGEGWYQLGERAEALVPGKVFLISPGFEHGRTVNPQRLPRMLLARFSIVRNDSGASPEPPVPPFALAVEPPDAALFHSLFELLAFRHADERLTQTLAGGALAHILARLYLVLAEPASVGDADPRLERSVRYMREHLHASVSVRQLAGLAGLSDNYFRTLFRRSYGVNPHQYRTKLRMKRAKELLLETDDKVKDIAEALGFGDPFAFSKQFKAYHGVAPSRLRGSAAARAAELDQE